MRQAEVSRPAITPDEATTKRVLRGKGFSDLKQTNSGQNVVSPEPARGLQQDRQKECVKSEQEVGSYNPDGDASKAKRWGAHEMEAMIKGNGRVDEEGLTASVSRGPKVQPEELQPDIAATYNAYKEFEGRRYTGVKVGRGQKWYYDEGVWKERKVAPDKWEFTYSVGKRRAGKAPEGSGAPVGTEYHWYILAHQIVRKLNANDYSTSMTGVKHKLAHKRVTADKWSATDSAQRRHLIKILEGMIADLKGEIELPEPAELEKTKVAATTERRPEPAQKAACPGMRRGVRSFLGLRCAFSAWRDREQKPSTAASGRTRSVPPRHPAPRLAG